MRTPRRFDALIRRCRARDADAAFAFAVARFRRLLAMPPYMLRLRRVVTKAAMMLMPPCATPLR